MSTDRSFNAPENSNHPSRRQLNVIEIEGRLFRIERIRWPIEYVAAENIGGRWHTVARADDSNTLIAMLNARAVCSWMSPPPPSAGEIIPAKSRRYATALIKGDMVWSDWSWMFHRFEKADVLVTGVRVRCEGWEQEYGNEGLVWVAQNPEQAALWNVKRRRFIADLDSKAA